jgi:uridine kinase
MERQQWARDVELFSVQQLNRAIRDGNSKKVIQAVEANCDRQFVELANKIKNKAGVKLILIAGPSSSGKTTFAKRLQVQLESLGYKPEVISVDSFYKGWPDINSEGPHKVDWEALDSLNLKQLNDVLLTLMDGKEALVPEYDMKTSMPADKAHWSKMQLSTKGKGVIIMEGIHCLNPALTAAVPKEQKFQIAIAPIPALQLDATHLLSGTTIRMLRRMVRDYLNRGRPVLATLKQWPGVVKGERDNIYPHQGNADAVMNSEIGYEMCVLKVHVEPLLKTVCPTEREYSEVRRLLQTLEQFIALPTTVIPPQSLLREFVGGSWYYDFGGWYKSY